ncbi:hypothetical protein [Desulfovibrio legallii]|nr:hypothetical protein [Desulfovibrio legallii]
MQLLLLPAVLAADLPTDGIKPTRLVQIVKIRGSSGFSVGNPCQELAG